MLVFLANNIACASDTRRGYKDKSICSPLPPFRIDAMM